MLKLFSGRFSRRRAAAEPTGCRARSSSASSRRDLEPAERPAQRFEHGPAASADAGGRYVLVDNFS